jgi:hypothetical protein
VNFRQTRALRARADTGCNRGGACLGRRVFSRRRHRLEVWSSTGHTHPHGPSPGPGPHPGRRSRFGPAVPAASPERCVSSLWSLRRGPTGSPARWSRPADPADHVQERRSGRCRYRLEGLPRHGCEGRQGQLAQPARREDALGLPGLQRRSPSSESHRRDPPLGAPSRLASIDLPRIPAINRTLRLGRPRSVRPHLPAGLHSSRPHVAPGLARVRHHPHRQADRGGVGARRVTLGRPCRSW